MTIITTKTNGQFPSRKNGETNVLRPVVSQSKMYEGASNKSLRMSNSFIRISIVLLMLLFVYLAFLFFGIDFNLVLMKLQSILLGKSLHFLFSRLGWCGGGIILLSVLFFDPETMGKMMAPSGASGSGEGRGFRWTDLFGSSSTGNSETSVNQAGPEDSVNQPEPAANPGEPAAPMVYLPLQEDGQRRLELGDRLRLNTIGHPLKDSIFDDILETQFRTELQIEKALRSDRVQDSSFLEQRHEIRGVLFYPTGSALSLETYMAHLTQIETHGTHRSLPYRRIMDAIYNKDLFLDFDGIKKRRAW
ncbi:hypothetical protein HRI_005288800 [Hibiscus trionum]|uniref:Uncharacterized protein n=1 Tax=Hibiscus trionum TaxID=183268 RepID=A0A9W7MY38_HIBTR|nr:hypothetical protein HRI_003250700 [Hibiscus trionum]GMJ16196.1 hypothetical protein HRI_005288800 [Hibiscus trionum]